MNSELYAFVAGYPMSAFKIAHYASTDKLVKTTLSTNPHHWKMTEFSVCHVADKIILSGGFVDKRHSAQTSLFDVLTDMWEQKSSCPDLNQ